MTRLSIINRFGRQPGIIHRRYGHALAVLLLLLFACPPHHVQGRTPYQWVSQKLDDELDLTNAKCELVLRQDHHIVTSSDQFRILYNGNAHWICGRINVPDATDAVIALKTVSATTGDVNYHPLQTVTATASTPYDVVLVLDRSYSMHENDPQDLRKEAVRRFYKMARNSPQIRSLSIVTFHSRAQTILEPTPPGELEDIEPYLDKLKPTGSTAYDPPLLLAYHLLEKTGGTRQAVLFLSDGEPKWGYKNAHIKFAERRCPIYTIGLTEDADADMLQTIAEDTNGKFFDAPTAAALEDRFSQIFQMITRPRVVLEETIVLADRETVPIWLDPTMRGPMLTLAPSSGTMSVSINDGNKQNLDVNALLFRPLENLPYGRHELQFHGTGRLALKITADTDVALETLHLTPKTAIISPLSFAFYLTGAEQLDGLSAVCTLTDSAGNPIDCKVERTEFGLYTVRAPDAGRGRFTAKLAVRGNLGPHQVVRKTTMSFERQAQNMPEAASTGPAVPQKVDIPTERQSKTIAPAPGKSADSSVAMATTFRAEPEEISMSGLYPGGKAGQTSLMLLLNTKDRTSPRLTFEPEPPEGLTINLEGRVRPNRRNQLVITARAASDAAGQLYDGALSVYTGAEKWSVPVRIEAATPVIHAEITPVRTSRKRKTLTAENQLVVKLAPDGNCPVNVITDVQGLEIAPNQINANTTPQHLNLRMRADITAEGLQRKGTIDLTAPGLDPVSIPYQIQVGGHTPGTTPLAAPVRFPLWLILAAAAIAVLLIFLLRASIQGSRRALFLMISVAIHAALLFVVMPKSRLREETPSGPATVQIQAGQIIVEELMPTETVTEPPVLSDSSPTETSRQKKDITVHDKQQEKEESRLLPTPEQELPKIEAELDQPVNQVEKQAIQTAEIEPDRPDKIERKHARNLLTEVKPEDAQSNRLSTPAKPLAEPSQPDVTDIAPDQKVREKSAATTINTEVKRAVIRLSSLEPKLNTPILRRQNDEMGNVQNDPAQPHSSGKAVSAPIQPAAAETAMTTVNIASPTATVKTTATFEPQPELTPAALLPAGTLVKIEQQPQQTAKKRRAVSQAFAQAPAPQPSDSPAHRRLNSKQLLQNAQPTADEIAVPAPSQGITVGLPGTTASNLDLTSARKHPALADLAPTEKGKPRRQRAEWQTETDSAPVETNHNRQTGGPAVIRQHEPDRPGHNFLVAGPVAYQSSVQPPALDNQAPRLTVARSKNPFADLPVRTGTALRAKTSRSQSNRKTTAQPAVSAKPQRNLSHTNKTHGKVTAKAIAPDSIAGRVVATENTKQSAAALPPSPGSARSGQSRWRNTFPNLQHDGDWDCDRTAMLNLAHKFEQRTGSAIPYESRNVNVANANLQQAPFLFMSGHNDFSFSQQETEKLKEYLHNGGYLWINDSTDIGDETYDTAIRRELARLIPDARLQKIPMTHQLFKGPYDLTDGYKGYRVPPGDKYRQDYLEGLWIGDRLAVIYTRNDYGDGLEIDARTNPLMESLTDLSPQEMQEGAIRMGTNIAMYCINRGRPADVTFITSETPGTDNEAAAKNSDLTLAPVKWNHTPQDWITPEGWGEQIIESTVQKSDREGLLILTFSAGDSFKRRQHQATVGRDCTGENITSNKVLLIDVLNSMEGGANIALGLKQGDDAYYETAPIFIRPGANTDLTFDLRKTTVKCASSNWEYTARLPKDFKADQIYLVLFPHHPEGQIQYGNFRIGN